MPGSRDTKLKIIVDAENRTQGTFNTLKRNLDGIKQQHEGLINAMKTVGKVGAVAFGALSLLTKGLVAAGAGFEQTQIAFETMLGSAEVAKKTLADLAQFARATPFELLQLEEASKRLLAYGITAEELIPTLEMLGNISAGVGMDKLPQLILAFGQVRAATKLTGMELRQFSETGVPLLGTLAEQLGKTEAEIMEMVSAGQIGFPMVQQALASLSAEGGKFENLMARQSTSLAGMWSNFRDQLSLTARAMGEELLPHLKPLVERLIQLAETVGRFATEHPKLTTAILAGALAFTALMAVLFPIAIMLPGLILLFGGLATAFAFIATGPGLIIVAAIAGIVLALTHLAQQGFFTKQAWLEVWDGMRIMAAEGANAVIGIFESMVNWIIAQINKLITYINRVLSLMQKVPGLGKKIGTIGNINSISMDRFNPESSLVSRPSLVPQSSTQLMISGNTFLDQDSAEKMGDLLIQRLKLSNAI